MNSSMCRRTEPGITNMQERAATIRQAQRVTSPSGKCRGLVVWILVRVPLEGQFPVGLRSAGGRSKSAEVVDMLLSSCACHLSGMLLRMSPMQCSKLIGICVGDWLASAAPLAAGKTAGNSVAGESHKHTCDARDLESWQQPPLIINVSASNGDSPSSETQNIHTSHASEP